MIHPSGFWAPSCSSTRLPWVSHGTLLLLKQKFTFQIAGFHKTLRLDYISERIPGEAKVLRASVCLTGYHTWKLSEQEGFHLFPLLPDLPPEQIIHDTAERQSPPCFPGIQPSSETGCKEQWSGLERHSAPLFTVATATDSGRQHECSERGVMRGQEELSKLR